MANAVDLLEIGLGARTKAINERLECLSVGTVLGLELPQLGLRASQYELGERRGVCAQTRAKRPERSGKRRSLGDRVAGMRGRHGGLV